MGANEPSYQAIVKGWFDQLERAVLESNEAEITSLFLSEAYWRDALALTWKIQTLSGGEEIVKVLHPAFKAAGASSFEIDLSGNPPCMVTRVDRKTIEAFFSFETESGRGKGIVRLCPDASDGNKYRAWTLLTALEELKGFEETTGQNRPVGQSHSRDFQGPNWLDQRKEEQTYKDREPTVLVIGGGQAGLAIAARLRQLGIDNLIVDKNARIGDNWRNRYHALTLHNQVQVNHMPYMPFPPTWPTYIPKDMLANWFEAYVDALELNFWTGTEVTEGAYDEAAQKWTIRLRNLDGTSRELHPRHVVVATGASGIPNRPEIPTLDAFSGPVQHSCQYQDGEVWAGKKAIIIGSGNSAHDIAQDLYSSGAEVTMIQRNPTLVVNIEPSAQLPYALYNEGRALEDCDLITTSMPMPLVKQAHVNFTRQSQKLDKSLLEGLKQIGFKLDEEENSSGWQFKYLTRGGGYYFNVGCSNMLVDGKIGLIQYDQLDTFLEHGVRLKNGETIAADLVVLATGYMPQEYLVAELFGDAVAERVGPIWGFGDQLELRNMYCRTGQPGLWFIAGSLAQCRINSKFLGLQIKALEEGLLPDDGF